MSTPFDRPRPDLPFTSSWLLAPMEGVTEPCFREMVLARNPATALGGAFTEFVRVTGAPLPRRVLRAHLGSRRFDAPVGLQLMGSDAACVAHTARRAVEAGAALVDLNFGCPAKGALRTCAGSAMLRDPRALERMVRCTVLAVGGAPVTAKIRAGYDDTSLLEDLARAVESGGARMLSVHCRTRLEAYQEEVDWSRIARARAAVTIPVCGNGSVRTHADLERMRSETGCAFVMVGRGALADPWIFSGHRATLGEAASFLLEYARLLAARNAGALPHARRGPRTAARIKQLLRHWTAGDLVGSAGMPDRRAWLRDEDVIGRLEGLLAHSSEPRSPVDALTRS